jgi:hypothetical protein
MLVLLASSLVACIAPSERLNSATVNNLTCEGSSELIVDPLFTTINDIDSPWQYNQHAGDQSLKVDATEGTLTFKRIGSEPWAMFRQTITDERLDAATIRYTADLRGDVSSEVTHFFGAKAGLFLQINQYPDAYVGDQNLSNGQWDWQAYGVTKTLP